MAGQYKCAMCGAAFDKESELQEHGKTHMAAKPAAQYRCAACGAEFATETDLHEHAKVHMKK